MCVCFHEILRLIIMKMEMKMKNRSQRYDINKIRFEAPFMKKLSSTEAELKKKRCLKINVYYICIRLAKKYSVTNKP